MTQLSLWLASLVLVWGVLYFGLRAYRIFKARFRAEQQTRRADWPNCTWRRSKRLRARSTPRTARRRTISAACSSTRRLWRASSACPTPRLQAVRTAALLHDIGKLAVPEHILSKPGPLTAEEFQKVQAHPQVGADIIAAVPFPYPVAPLIQTITSGGTAAATRVASRATTSRSARGFCASWTTSTR